MSAMRWTLLALALVGCDSPVAPCAPDPEQVYLISATPVGGVNPCARYYKIGGEVYRTTDVQEAPNCDVSRVKVACGESTVSRCADGYTYSYLLSWGADGVGRARLDVTGECSSAWDLVYTPTRP
jgi:hypothetical protein